VLEADVQYDKAVLEADVQYNKAENKWKVLASSCYAAYDTHLANFTL